MKKILLTSLAFLILSSNILFAQTKEFIGVIGAAIGDIKNQKDEILLLKKYSQILLYYQATDFLVMINL